MIAKRTSLITSLTSVLALSMLSACRSAYECEIGREHMNGAPYVRLEQGAQLSSLQLSEAFAIAMDGMRSDAAVKGLGIDTPPEGDGAWTYVGGVFERCANNNKEVKVADQYSNGPVTIEVFENVVGVSYESSGVAVFIFLERLRNQGRLVYKGFNTLPLEPLYVQ